MNPISFTFNPYNEKAPKLSKSPFEGKAKSRLHLSNAYTKGKDPYAIAAEVIKPKKEGEPPKLNWIQKKFYIIQKDSNPAQKEIFYKINKLSLQNRLGISSTELKEATKTGEVVDLIQTKYNKKIDKDIAQHLMHFHKQDPKEIEDYIKKLPAHLTDRVIEKFVQGCEGENLPKLQNILEHLEKNYSSLRQSFEGACNKRVQSEARLSDKPFTEWNTVQKGERREHAQLRKAEASAKLSEKLQSVNFTIAKLAHPPVVEGPRQLTQQGALFRARKLNFATMSDEEFNELVKSMKKNPNKAVYLVSELAFQTYDAALPSDFQYNQKNNTEEARDLLKHRLYVAFEAFSKKATPEVMVGCFDKICRDVSNYLDPKIGQADQEILMPGLCHLVSTVSEGLLGLLQVTPNPEAMTQKVKEKLKDTTFKQVMQAAIAFKLEDGSDLKNNLKRTSDANHLGIAFKSSLKQEL